MFHMFFIISNLPIGLRVRRQQLRQGRLVGQRPGGGAQHRGGHYLFNFYLFCSLIWVAYDTWKKI